MILLFVGILIGTFLSYPLYNFVSKAIKKQLETAKHAKELEDYQKRLNDLKWKSRRNSNEAIPAIAERLKHTERGFTPLSEDDKIN